MPQGLARRSPGDGGSSLVEVLLATLLLATSLAALAQMLVLGIRATAEAHETTHAVALASQKIEELRAAPFPAPVADATDAVGAFDRRWTVASLPGDSPDGVVIAVTVIRRGAASRHSVRLVTVRTRRSDE
ncbi:MAG: hypothetical protein HY824_17510 [Acidobacteria bacterium]|nr:hypothetical protein [Acidobacteriota bacterium]